MLRRKVQSTSAQKRSETLDEIQAKNVGKVAAIALFQCGFPHKSVRLQAVSRGTSHCVTVIRDRQTRSFECPRRTNKDEVEPITSCFETSIILGC